MQIFIKKIHFSEMRFKLGIGKQMFEYRQTIANEKTVTWSQL
jgi:hypothetical protein